MRVVKLNTEITMPIVGCGTNTYGKENDRYDGAIDGDTTELDRAIAMGYRHFDTAISYRNESVIGAAVKKSGIPREEFFITSKIPGRPEYTSTEEAVHQAVASSLKALDTSYIDLYLIHHPWEDLAEMLAVWNILETYVDKGVLKAIGVSNFNKEQLGYLLEHARIKPAVNQVESHPGNWNDEIIAYCKENLVIPQAWGPLSRIDSHAKRVLAKIAQHHDKGWAQIVLRYQIERRVVVIPKSHNEVRQRANIQIFDFQLTEEEKAEIAKL